MNKLYEKYNVSKEIIKKVEESEEKLKEQFLRVDEISRDCLYKVIFAFQKNRVSIEHMNGTTGYGYDDAGRDTLESIYADIFNAEAALVRPQITCGTHAISTALFAVLRPGDELLSPVGRPYDTLEEVIGIRESKGSLSEFGVKYKEVNLKENGDFDFENIKKAINEKTKMVTIQRSKGYSDRSTLSVEKIGELISYIKSVKKDVICFVDNCYGEFTETMEPTDVNADICAGSLIKNLGGGLAPTGGYIVGKKDLIELCAVRLTSPGLGSELGASLNVLRSFYQGLFYAPNVVASALKGAILLSAVYENFGFVTHPSSGEIRHDIIQAIRLNTPEALIAFCEGIQAAAPVDSFVRPEPSDMPGYDSKVIMAAGAFISGASIELSADGPLREPYNVYYQGGLSYDHARLGIILSLQKLLDKKQIKLI